MRMDVTQLRLSGILLDQIPHCPFSQSRLCLCRTKERDGSMSLGGLEDRISSQILGEHSTYRRIERDFPIAVALSTDGDCPAALAQTKRCMCQSTQFPDSQSCMQQDHNDRSITQIACRSDCREKSLFFQVCEVSWWRDGLFNQFDHPVRLESKEPLRNAPAKIAFERN